MIDMEAADRGAALLTAAIGELVEDAAAEAAKMSRGDWRVWIEPRRQDRSSGPGCGGAGPIGSGAGDLAR